jgi:hypothetical protein
LLEEVQRDAEPSLHLGRGSVGEMDLHFDLGRVNKGFDLLQRMLGEPAVELSRISRTKGGDQAGLAPADTGIAAVDD